MTKFRTELNNALSPYMQRIIELNKKFQLYSATKELKEMYHPAIIDEAEQLANVAKERINAAYDNYIQRLNEAYTIYGIQIDEKDIQLLNPTIFHLTQWEFDKLCDKHAGNATMEAALRSYAESMELLFEKDAITKQQKEEIALQVLHTALNDVRRNNVHELVDWCVIMCGEFYSEVEQLTE